MPFRRRGEVRARLLAKPWSWRTESGAQMTAASGDWLVTDPETGRQWSADPAAFDASHEALGGDRYRRTGIVQARPAQLGERVRTLEGPSVAAVGDWLVEGDLHERWLVPGPRFTAAYEAL